MKRRKQDENEQERKSYLCKNSRPPAGLDSEPNNSIMPSHCYDKNQKRCSKC